MPRYSTYIDAVVRRPDANAEEFVPMQLELLLDAKLGEEVKFAEDHKVTVEDDGDPYTNKQGEVFNDTVVIYIHISNLVYDNGDKDLVTWLTLWLENELQENSLYLDGAERPAVLSAEAQVYLLDKIPVTNHAIYS